MLLEPPPGRVALFDMDRTLVNVHTARLYVRFQRDMGELGPLQLMRTSYWLSQYTLGIVNAEGVAMKVLRDYRGKPAEWLVERCRGWFRQYVQPHVSAVGTQRVEQYRAKDCPMAIATSAVRYAAAPLAEHLSIPNLICSELEVRDERLTGQYEKPLCYGAGKLDRCRAFIKELGASLAEAAFYTDSITDLPLLDAVGYPIAVNPDPRLRRVALARGWPIENWRSFSGAPSKVVPSP